MYIRVHIHHTRKEQITRNPSKRKIACRHVVKLIPNVREKFKIHKLDIVLVVFMKWLRQAGELYIYDLYFSLSSTFSFVQIFIKLIQ